MCPDTAQKDIVRTAVSSYELKIPGEGLEILRSTKVYLSKCSPLPSKVLSAQSVGMTTKFAASQILSPLPKHSTGHQEVTK